jgi:hypothetical protein
VVQVATKFLTMLCLGDLLVHPDFVGLPNLQVDWGPLVACWSCCLPSVGFQLVKHISLHMQ